MKSVFPFGIGSRKQSRIVRNHGKPVKPLWLNASIWSSLACLLLLIACGPSPTSTPMKKASDRTNITSAPYDQGGGGVKPQSAQTTQPCKADGEACANDGECCTGRCLGGFCGAPPG